VLRFRQGVFGWKEACRQSKHPRNCKDMHNIVSLLGATSRTSINCCHFNSKRFPLYYEKVMVTCQTACGKRIPTLITKD
jgi:hypothetical protein